MRTHNLALTAIVLLVVGGLLSGLWIFQKSGFVEERALSSAGSAFVQTAQGANLDASAVAIGTNTTFSSLSSVSGLSTDLSAAGAPASLYSTGAIKGF